MRKSPTRDTTEQKAFTRACVLQAFVETSERSASARYVARTAREVAERLGVEPQQARLFFFDSDSYKSQPRSRVRTAIKALEAEGVIKSTSRYGRRDQWRLTEAVDADREAERQERIAEVVERHGNASDLHITIDALAELIKMEAKKTDDILALDSIRYELKKALKSARR